MNQDLSFRASIAHPALAELYDLWERLRLRLGRLPYRQEISPLDLSPKVLPTFMILEREASGRYRCRLAGSFMREIYRFEATGWYLDEIMSPTDASVRVGIFECVLRERRAALCRLRLALPGREFIATDRLYVPVLDADPAMPNVLLSSQSFLYASDISTQPDRQGVYDIRYDDPASA